MMGREAPSAERVSVGQICTAMHHAYRGLRLYPSDHPSARQAIDTLVNTVTSHVDDLGPIYLQIEEMRVLYEGEQVYSYEGSRDNLAFLMFRDGIRRVSFHPGVEPWEIEAFVDALSHADDLADVDHDLATTLWEHEMHHIEYEVVDPFLTGGEELRSAAVDDLRETVVRRLRDLSPDNIAKSETGGGSGFGARGEGDQADDEDAVEPDSDEVEAESVTLSQEDMELIEQIVADSSEVLDDFAVVLLEIIGAGLETPNGDDPSARSLSMVVQQYIDLGRMDGVALVLERIKTLEAEGRRPADFAPKVMGTAVTPARLSGLIARMHRAEPSENARTEQLLGEMRSWIYPALLETLAENSDKSVRKTVLALLHSDTEVPVEHLWPLMHDSRWYVVRNAVQLARGSDDPELPGQLERLLRHPDERVRREVMRSLDVLGGSRAASLLVRALQDMDSAVRTLAVRSLGRHGNRSHFSSVRAQVETKEFETRSAEELQAFLQSYAVLGGESTVEPLNKLWKKRIFGTRPLPLRVAAVQALGHVPSPAAREALGEASRSNETQVQRAAARALSGAQSRIAGRGT